MSQQRVTEELQQLGMSGYEAKAYVALVAAGAPLNGSEVARRSGVPRSTVYETLSKLVGREAAYEVRDGEANVGYIALPPSALLDRMQREFGRSMERLGSALPEIAAPPAVRLMHSLSDRSSVLARAEDVIAAASAELFVSGWPDDIGTLKAPARQADEEGVDVRVVVFGEDDDPVGSTTIHRWSPPEVVLENLGCRLMVVSADREQAVIGGFIDDKAWGVYTDDPAVALVAVDYVRHDIAVHVIAKNFSEDEFSRIWDDPELNSLYDKRELPTALLAHVNQGFARPPRRKRRRIPIL